MLQATIKGANHFLEEEDPKPKFEGKTSSLCWYIVSHPVFSSPAMNSNLAKFEGEETMRSLLSYRHDQVVRYDYGFIIVHKVSSEMEHFGQKSVISCHLLCMTAFFLNIHWWILSMKIGITWRHVTNTILIPHGLTSSENQRWRKHRL